MVSFLRRRLIHVLTVLSCVALTAQLHAQSSWQWQSPMPQGNNLNDVAFIDGNTGFAVGAGGVVLQTNNRGGSWTQVMSGTSNNLNRIFFATKDSGWIVGDGGTIFATGNSGSTWTVQTAGTNKNLYDVMFVDRSTGFAVGDNGTILRTYNSGVDWTKLNSQTSMSLRGISFINSSIGWVVGLGGTVANTNNHGDSWTASVVDPNTDLYTVWFADMNTGWIGGSTGSIWHTDNGGGIWTSDGANTSNQINRIGVVMCAYKVAACNSGTVLVSAIHDSVWYTQTQPITDQNLNSVNVVSDTSANPYQVRFVGNAGVILTSNNDALSNSFSSLAPGTRSRIHDVFFTGQTAGFAACDSGIVYRTYNGMQWVATTVGADPSLNGVAFCPVNQRIGVVVGLNGAVYWTSNAGTSWYQDTAAILQGHSYFGVCFSRFTRCFVVGNGGVIYAKDTGANATWMVLTSPTSKNLYSVDFDSSDYGFVVGESGGVYKTTDGGQTWASQNVNTNQDLYKIRIVHNYLSNNNTDATFGWIVGNTGVVRRTIDGGTKWMNANAGIKTGGALRAISITDVNHGVIVGDGGAAYATVNGGVTWSAMATPTTNNLNGVWIVNNTVGWAVGDYGTVIFNANLPLPIELLTFDGWSQGNAAMLQWKTASEVDNSYFQLERSSNNQNWQSVTTIAGQGTSPEGASYQYVDNGLTPDVYYYRLKQVNNDGSFEYVGNQVEINIGAASDFSLYQNYPNPFSGSTTITYNVQSSSHVKLVVMNVLGDIVQTIQDADVQAGQYQMNFDASKLAAGTYFYRLFTNGNVYSHQMVLIK